MTETVFYLVRHGEGEQNVLDVCSSWPEKQIFHLTKKGVEQAEAAAELIARSPVNRIYSSPLTRTMETAKIIAGAVSVDVIVDERIRETDFGVYDNNPIKRMWGKYPTDISRIDTDEREIESFRSVSHRVKNFLVDRRNEVGECIVVVSHGDPLQVMIGMLRGMTLEESLINEWYPKKGEVTKIVVTDDFWIGLAEQEKELSVPASTDPVTIDPERK